MKSVASGLKAWYKGRSMRISRSRQGIRSRETIVWIRSAQVSAQAVAVQNLETLRILWILPKCWSWTVSGPSRGGLRVSSEWLSQLFFDNSVSPPVGLSPISSLCRPTGRHPAPLTFPRIPRCCRPYIGNYKSSGSQTPYRSVWPPTGSLKDWCTHPYRDCIDRFWNRYPQLQGHSRPSRASARRIKEVGFVITASLERRPDLAMKSRRRRPHRNSFVIGQVGLSDSRGRLGALYYSPSSRLNSTWPFQYAYSGRWAFEAL